MITLAEPKLNKLLMQKTSTFYKGCMLLLFFFSVCACPFIAKAQPTLGSEMFVTSLDKDFVKVSLILYLDCHSLDFKPSVTVKPKNSTETSLTLMEIGYNEDIDITPINDVNCQCNRCNGYTVVYKHLYEGKVDLSKYNDCEFTFFINSLSKYIPNVSFTENAVYLEAKINRCIDGYINSPQFNTDPFLFSIKQCISIPMSASAGSKDSLVYSLVSPRTAKYTNFNYPAGFSYTSPLEYDGYPSNSGAFSSNSCKGFKLNANTGELKFRPTKGGTTVADIKVTQYHPDSTGKMVNVGEVTRELIFTIYDENVNSEPVIYAPIDTNFYICAGNQFNLNFKTTAAVNNNNNKTSLVADFDIPLAIFKLDTSSYKASGKFTWEPQLNSIRKNPYKLFVSVYDRKNLFTSSNKREYNIYVVSPKPEITISQTDKGCGLYKFSLEGDTDQIAKYDWFLNDFSFSTEKEPSYKLNKNGKYIIKLLATNKAKCVTEIYSDTLIVTTLPNLDLGEDFESCIGEKITLNPFADNKYTYQWQRDSTLTNDTAANQVVTLNSSHTYIVTAKNASGCVATDTLNITVKDFSVSASNDTAICYGNAVNLIVKSSEDFLTYSWSPNAGIYFTNDTLLVRPIKTTTYIVTAKNALGCIRTDSVKVNVSTTKANAGDDVSICRGTGITLHGTGGYNYAWLNIRGDTLSKNQDVYVDPLITEEYYLHTDDSLHCQHSIDNVVVNVSTLPLEIIKDTTICQGDSILLWSDGGDTYKWLPENTLTRYNTKTTKAFPLETTTYTVYIQDTTKMCSDSRSVKISVNKDCVWPGDANKDGIVDYKDVLEIGVGYGSTGNYRENGTRNWKSAMIKDWDKFTYDDINYKHLDCNGDGYIDAADKFVVEDNYGKTHASTFVNKTAEPSQDSIYFQFTKDTFYAGEMITANLNLGNAANPFTNAYGVAYQYIYTDENNSSNSVSFKTVCEAICADNDFMLQSLHNYPQDKTGEIAQVRTGLKNVSAQGKLATFSYILEDSTHNYPANGEWIYLKLLQTKIIDSQGKEYALKAVNDSALILKSKTQQVGIEQNKSIFSNIRIWPNPAKNILSIESEEYFSGKLYIINTLGEILLTEDLQHQKQKSIDIKHFPAGIYMLKITNSKNEFMQKLIIYK